MKDPNVVHEVLCVPDVHRPYHDERAFDLVLNIIDHRKPDYVVQLGDFGDFAAVASHPKKFGREERFERELADVRNGVKCLQQATGRGQLVFLQGNHEERYERYAALRAPAIESTLPAGRTLLGLRPQDRWVPYQSSIKLGDCVTFVHDVGHSGKNATAQTLDAVGHCVVHGHTHRGAIVFDGNVNLNERRFAMGCGWLGDRTKITYMHPSKTRSWQLGFGLLSLAPSPDGSKWIVDPEFCAIYMNRVRVAGQEYAT